MCNILCEPEEDIHAVVVGSWIGDIEYLRREGLGAKFTYTEHDVCEDYDSHGFRTGTRLEVLAIEHAPEGRIPVSQMEEGYVFPYLITFQILNPKEVTVGSQA